MILLIQESALPRLEGMTLCKQRISAAFRLGWIEIFIPRQQYPQMAKEVAHAGGVGGLAQEMQVLCRPTHITRCYAGVEFP